MKNKGRKILFGLTTVAFLASVGYGVYAGIENENLKYQISQEQSGTIQIIEDLRNSVKALTENKSKLEKDLALLTSRYSQLEEQKQALESQNSELITNNTELQNKLNQITTEKNALETEITSLRENLETTENALKSANALLAEEREISADRILELENEITRLNGLLNGYDDIKNGTFEVNFYNGETLIETKVAKTNTTVLAPTEDLSKAGSTFLGYSLDKINVVNVNEVVIKENTNFYAVYGHVWSGAWEGTTENGVRVTLDVYNSGIAKVSYFNFENYAGCENLYSYVEENDDESYGTNWTHMLKCKNGTDNLTFRFEDLISSDNCIKARLNNTLSVNLYKKDNIKNQKYYPVLSGTYTCSYESMGSTQTSNFKIQCKDDYTITIPSGFLNIEMTYIYVGIGDKVYYKSLGSNEIECGEFLYTENTLKFCEKTFDLTSQIESEVQ